MKIHTEGCLDIFSAKIKSNIGAVGGIGIGIGLLQVNLRVSVRFDFCLIQLVGMLFAFYLANTIKKEYETV